MDNDTQRGFSLEYPHISLHAIARDEQVHPRQCLYVMVDAKVDLPGISFETQRILIDTYNIDISEVISAGFLIAFTLIRLHTVVIQGFV